MDLKEIIRLQQLSANKDAASYNKDGAQVIDLGYKPRPFQAKIHRALRRFNVIVCHRRFGKTVLGRSEVGDHAFRNELHNPQYAYIAPTYKQAELVAWQYFKDYFKNVPGFESNEQKLRITIPRPARGDVIKIFLIGADNPDSIRGIYLDGVVLDEFAQCDPAIWGEIVRPLLADRKGWAIFIGTPKGQNHFFDIFTEATKQMHEGNRNWFACKYPASVTGVLDAEELRDAKATMSDSQYAQEFEVSFTASLTGSYYGTYMQELESRGQVKAFSYDPIATVSTYWDLGIGDATAIWFMQTIGKEVRIIDYYENTGKGLEHYAQTVKGKPYVYEEHWLPHDGAARELGTGRTRQEVLTQYGIRTRIGERQGVEDGINAVRMLLPKCWFNIKLTEKGLTALKNYQRKWDGKKKMFDEKPLHDWTSHAADAFRLLAMNYNESGTAKRFQDLERHRTYDYAGWGF